MAELEQELNQPSEAQQRITQLSKNLKEKAEAEAEANRKAAEAETRATEAEKKAAFAEGFADIISVNPAAKDHKADIQAKVLGGYSMQDATYAVLGPLGKIAAPAPALAEPSLSPAGGSASYAPPSGGAKAFTDLTQEERRKAIEELGQRGDISF